MFELCIILLFLFLGFGTVVNNKNRNIFFIEIRHRRNSTVKKSAEYLDYLKKIKEFKVFLLLVDFKYYKKYFIIRPVQFRGVIMAHVSLIS
ncbi:MAG: hypothetical protein WCO35_02525 [Candidatus Nomurabacteria bacterium]